MASCARIPDAPDPDAVAFIRFCRGRRRVCWPELYDEMWAVASRGLFRGLSFTELEERGVAFGLAQMPRLAALVAEVIRAEGPAEPILPMRRLGAGGPQRRGLAIRAGEDEEPRDTVVLPDLAPRPATAVESPQVSKPAVAALRLAAVG